MTTTTTEAVRFDSKTDDLIKAMQAQLASAVVALRGDERWAKMLDAMSSFHTYSFNNQMLIHMQTGGTARLVAGYRKWQELKRQVRKGEKCIRILRPCVVQATVTDDNGAPVKGANGKDQKQSKVVGFATASVFDIAQTEGEPLPGTEAMVLSDEPPAGFDDDLVAAIERLGYTVHTKERMGLTNGFTSPTDRQVAISADLTPANRAKTLAHELGHIVAGHTDRMDEYHTGHGGQRNAMEVEAESIAYVLCRMNGLDTVGYSAQYCASWGGTSDERVKQAAETVSKAIKAIIDDNAWQNVKEVTA